MHGGVILDALVQWVYTRDIVRKLKVLWITCGIIHEGVIREALVQQVYTRNIL